MSVLANLAERQIEQRGGEQQHEDDGGDRGEHLALLPLLCEHLEHHALDVLIGSGAEHNADPKPFVWTKRAEQILDKVNRLNASVH